MHSTITGKPTLLTNRTRTGARAVKALQRPLSLLLGNSGLSISDIRGKEEEEEKKEREGGVAESRLHGIWIQFPLSGRGLPASLWTAWARLMIPLTLSPVSSRSVTPPSLPRYLSNEYVVFPEDCLLFADSVLFDTSQSRYRMAGVGDVAGLPSLMHNRFTC
ncbi:hypothetical protein VTG60DRAFT_1480 [Thermothelomyces hinnuleus]